MAYWAVNIPPLLSFIINLILLSRFVGFPGLRYFNTIFLKNLLLIGASAIIPWLVQSQMPEGFLRFIVVCTLSVVCTVANLWLFGMNQATKQMVREKVLSKIHK